MGAAFPSRKRPPRPARETLVLRPSTAETYSVFVAHRLQPEYLRARTSREPGLAKGSGWEDMVAKEDRGFASMDRNKQREIASKGGKAAHQKGTAHEWTS